MKNVFDGLISRLDMTKERISELENMLIETSYTKKQEVKRIKNKAPENIQELWGTHEGHNIRVTRIPEGEETEEISEVKGCHSL